MYRALPIIPGSTLSTSQDPYYTCPAGTSTRITQMSVTNTDSVVRTVNIWIASTAGIPGVADQIIKSKALAPNETWVPYQVLGATLGAGNVIVAQADAAGVVVLKSSGIELT